MRAAQGIRAQGSLGRPWILVAPAPEPGSPSIGGLPEIADACGDDYFALTFAMSEQGAASQKSKEIRAPFPFPRGLSAEAARADKLNALLAKLEGGNEEAHLLRFEAVHLLKQLEDTGLLDAPGPAG